MPHITPEQHLNAMLDEIADETELPSLVVASNAGQAVAAAAGSIEVDEVAVLSAMRLNGNPNRADVLKGRVKARSVQVGEDEVILGAMGDTALCAAVFDEAEQLVRATFS